MAEIDLEESEVRLDDTEQIKLIRFYRERPMLWDISIKLPTSAKEQRDALLKELEEHFAHQYKSSECVYAEGGEKNEQARGQWKCFKALHFLKPTIILDIVVQLTFQQ